MRFGTTGCADGLLREGVILSHWRGQRWKRCPRGADPAGTICRATSSEMTDCRTRPRSLATAELQRNDNAS
jgi:hypothetical protein